MCTSESARRLNACIWQTAWRSATLAVARRRLTKGIAVRNKDQRSDPTSLARLVNVCLSDVSKRDGKHVYAQSFWILVILLGLLWGACAGVLHMDNGDPLFEDLNIACTMQTKDAWYQQGKTNNESLISMCDHLCWPNLTLFFDRIDISKAYLHFHHRCIWFSGLHGVLSSDRILIWAMQQNLRTLSPRSQGYRRYRAGAKCSTWIAETQLAAPSHNIRRCRSRDAHKHRLRAESTFSLSIVQVLTWWEIESPPACTKKHWNSTEILQQVLISWGCVQETGFVITSSVELLAFSCPLPGWLFSRMRTAQGWSIPTTRRQI